MSLLFHLHTPVGYHVVDKICIPQQKRHYGVENVEVTSLVDERLCPSIALS